MTKQEHKLVSMLNYYEITIPPKKYKKDEKLNKLELSKFLDKISRNYDLSLLEDILEKIRSKSSTQNEMDSEQDSYEDMSEEFDDDYFKSEDTSKNDQNIDKNPIDSNILNDSFANNDINNFLKWLTIVLYSGDHNLIITDNGKSILIKLTRIIKGKK
jgi:hypothetical protein